jgi:hypothetical protein
LTPQYVSFETFSGSRHSIVRLFLYNYIFLRVVFLVLDAHIYNIQKTPLYSGFVILHLPSSLHNRHSWNIFLWLYCIWSESTNASVKIALIDIYHTCQNLLCNHTMHLHLPQTKKRWLLENTKLYKGYERKIKSDIKKNWKFSKVWISYLEKKVTWYQMLQNIVIMLLNLVTVIITYLNLTLI